MQRRPAYVPLLVDLQCQGLCQIERVLAEWTKRYDAKSEAKK